MGNVIDWSRLARPQEDGYGAPIFNAAALERFPQVAQRRLREGEPTFCEGRVALRKPPQKAADYLVSASFDHPCIARAETLLRDLWPAMYRHVQDTLLWFEPLVDTRFPDDNSMSGCTSGSSSSGFGGVCVTVNGDFGCVEGIVHEVGHQNLFALGVNLMTWGPEIVGNSMEDRYVSPIRKDITRPMGAVLQAFYSYVHVLHLNNLYAAAMGKSPDMHELNYSRIREGKMTLDAHFIPGTHGAEYMRGLDAWSVEVLAEAERLLGKATR